MARTRSRRRAGTSWLCCWLPSCSGPRAPLRLGRDRKSRPPLRRTPRNPSRPTTPPLERLGATIDDLTARLRAVRKSLVGHARRRCRTNPTERAGGARCVCAREPSHRARSGPRRARPDRRRLQPSAPRGRVPRRGRSRILRGCAMSWRRSWRSWGACGASAPPSRAASPSCRKQPQRAARVRSAPARADAIPKRRCRRRAERRSRSQLPSRSAAENRAADPASDTLQLEAKLAVAELKIAGLVSDLRSAQASREAIEAEAASLRALTDARIRQIIEAGPTASR